MPGLGRSFAVFTATATLVVFIFIASQESSLNPTHYILSQSDFNSDSDIDEGSIAQDRQSVLSKRIQTPLFYDSVSDSSSSETQIFEHTVAVPSSTQAAIESHEPQAYTINAKQELSIDSPWQDFLRPGIATSQVFATFQKYLAESSLQGLEQLPLEQFCSKNFTMTYVPNGSWGNAFNEVLNAFYYAILTERTIVIQGWRGSGETALTTNPLVAYQTDVQELRKKRGCPRDSGSSYKELHMETGESNDCCTDPSTISERWVKIHRLQKWIMPGILVANVHAQNRLKSLSKEKQDLLNHPAFAGVVILGAFQVDDFIGEEMKRKVLLLKEQAQKSKSSIELAIHLRHHSVGYEKDMSQCVAWAEKRAHPIEHGAVNNESTTLNNQRFGFVATDWPQTLPDLDKYVKQNLPTIKYTLDFVNFTVIEAENPELARSFKRTHAGRIWGTAGRGGWWGPNSSSLALLDLLLLGATRANAFIGTIQSTYSEIAIGIYLALTDWNFLEEPLPSHVIMTGRNCGHLALSKYAMYGITGGLTRQFNSVCPNS